MSETQSGIMIATPCYGGMLSEAYFHSIMDVIRSAKSNNCKIHLNTLGNESLITRARNTLVAQFLDLDQKHPGQFTHLMFIDADLSFKAEEVFRLVKSGHDVACGIYPQKSLNWNALQDAAENGISEGLEQAATTYNLNTKSGETLTVKNGFTEVAEAATGFMCIKKEVFYQLKEAYPQLKYNNDHRVNQSVYKSDNCYAFFDTLIDEQSRRYLSEDYAFCKRWSQIGGKIHADINSKLTHYGTYGFRGDLKTRLNLFKKSSRS